MSKEFVSVSREWLNAVSLMQMSHDELQEQAIEYLCEPCDEPQADAHPAAYIVQRGSILPGITGHKSVQFDKPPESCFEAHEVTPLFTRSDAAEIDRLSTVVEQQKSLIASLRAELRESYSIDAAVQEEHLDLEAAAKKLAACMDYPWEHMPEQGRASMREHATAVIGAALSVSAEPADLWSRPEERGCPELEPCSGCGTPGWTAACDKCIPY